MHRHNEGAFHFQKIRQQTVVQFRCDDLEKRYRAELLSHAEISTFGKLKGRRCNEVLHGQSARNQPVPGKPERFLLVDVKQSVHHFQTFVSVQRFCGDSETFEIVQNVRFHTFQTWLGRFHIVCFDGEREIFRFHQTVVSLSKLIPEHIGVFRSDGVKLISLQGNIDMLIGILTVRGTVNEGKLKLDGGIEIVEEVAPPVENGGFVLVGVQHIVDIRKTDGFRISGVIDAADSVGEHPLKRNTVLRGHPVFVFYFVFGNNRFNLFPFTSCQRFCHAVRYTPPGQVCPAVRGQCRNCWSCTAAAWDGGTGRLPCSEPLFQAADRFVQTSPEEKTAALRIP